MKYTTIVFFVLILIVVAGFFWSHLHRQNQTSQQEIEQVVVDGVAPASKAESFSGIGTLVDLQKQLKDLECQVIFERPNDTPIEGTLFTSKGSIRGDFLVPLEGRNETVLSSMIVGGDSLYVWSTLEGQTFGFKTDTSNISSINTKEPVPLDSMVKYTCSIWNVVDGSVFVPPADVSFKDVQTSIEAGMEDGTVYP